MTRFLLALLLSLAGCARRPDASIVFQSTRDGNFEIYSMNADGSGQQRLTTMPANDMSPSWAPDGKRILFTSDRDGIWEIYTMQSDGSSPTRLTRGHGSCTAPSWALQGSKILFVSTQDSPNGDLCLMNADGSNVQRLTTDSLVKDSPVMTPDGRAILMTINIKGRYRIASCAPATGTVQFLTPPDHNSVQPAISPDGKTVLFASDRAGTYEIYSMDLNGNNPVRVTTNSAGNLMPAWTRTPDEILLTRGGAIYRHSLDTGQEELLTFKGDSAPSSRIP